METTESESEKDPVRTNPSPAKVSVSMQISRRLNGRVERRLPLMITVRVSQGTDSPEARSSPVPRTSVATVPAWSANTPGKLVSSHGLSP